MMKAVMFGDKDVIQIIGGQDNYENNLSSIEEFNIKDMKSFEADWRLPKNLSGFAVTTKNNKIYVAGGKTRNYQTGENKVEN